MVTAKTPEITEEDLRHIGNQVAEGYKNGIVDGEDEDGNATRITWEIAMDKFINS